MSRQTKILLLIVAFLIFTVGSFVWFVATWDPGKEEPVSLLPGAISAA